LASAVGGGAAAEGVGAATDGVGAAAEAAKAVGAPCGGGGFCGGLILLLCRAVLWLDLLPSPPASAAARLEVLADGLPDAAIVGQLSCKARRSALPCCLDVCYRLSDAVLK
jgi:hypothetical protein